MNTTDDQFLRDPKCLVNLHGIKFPLEYLYRGLIAIGQPGSGKTRCILMPFTSVKSTAPRALPQLQS